MLNRRYRRPSYGGESSFELGFVECREAGCANVAVEIEHKFLVLSDGWRVNCVGSIRIVDGLVAATAGRKVRVRIADDQCYLTLKGARDGTVRDEFEYAIPREDADRLLASHCDNMILAKTRYLVFEDGFTFEVDVYEGLLDGVVLAEVELSWPGQVFPRPTWLGEEVTGRPEYKKANMLRARLALQTA